MVLNQTKSFNDDKLHNYVMLINHSHYFDHESAIKLLKKHTHDFILFSTDKASIRSTFDELTMFVGELK